MRVFIPPSNFMEWFPERLSANVPLDFFPTLSSVCCTARLVVRSRGSGWLNLGTLLNVTWFAEEDSVVISDVECVLFQCLDILTTNGITVLTLTCSLQISYGRLFHSV